MERDDVENAVIISAIVLTTSIPWKADRLVCTASKHLRYMKMVGEVGAMVTLTRWDWIARLSNG